MFHRLFYASQPETAASYYQRAKMSSRETKQVSRAPARQPITIHTQSREENGAKIAPIPVIFHLK